MRSFVRAFGAICLAISALALSATSVQAAIVFSSDFNDSNGFTTNVTSSSWIASGFTTGSNTAYLSLESVKLSLQASSSPSTPMVSIYSNSIVSGLARPGTLLTTLTGPQITNTLVAQDFLFTGNLSLSPTTSYWVVLSATGASNYLLETANNPPTAANSSGYLTISPTSGRRSTDGGTSWGNNSTTALGMIQVQAVPEPSTLVLAGIGIAGTVAVHSIRRRRHRLADESVAEAETV